MSTVQIIPGFSLTNRWLLYSSFMLAPAQFISGMGNNCPSNLGFLAYNWYTQIAWYRAIKAKQLHALSLVPVHLNLTFAITYLGGVTSGNIVMGFLLGFGTAGVIVLNSVAAWTSWATNQQEGFGVYHFFFFGWRTLTPGWHKFILLWQIGDSLMAFCCVIAAIGIPITLLETENDYKTPPWYLRYFAIPIGAAVMLLIGFPLILWTEFIVARNHIESATDMIAVWVFVAQAGSSPYLKEGISWARSNEAIYTLATMAVIQGALSYKSEAMGHGTHTTEQMWR
ncbi:hypothetical protein K469DRAFT_689678 [Zopfia rhizophila CBS 207.26]|uniref:Uncharacterized protein n=1 Tax=Zopfia rhizophila CBS 207.26 TaxID=1314779 RepID=A0A6A6DZU4_9PEZI|nr:hypothetical protein K469DRAFT_689678 [Zopfia rhizophila CBS 207.26]